MKPDNFIVKELENTDQDNSEYSIGQANIKVVGVGGAGNNIVSWLYKKGVKGAEIVACGTDNQHLDITSADRKILLGKGVTKGLGCGGFPHKGAEAAHESIQEIKDTLAGTDMAFICAGMGGGTGTGATPIIAQAAKEAGALVIGIVTMPFKIERARIDKADFGLKQLRQVSDTVVVIDNNRLVSIAGNLPIQQGFEVVNELASTLIKGTVEMIAVPSLINLDYADLKAIMTNGGIATIGVGTSKGTNRVEEAVKEAIQNPLLNVNYKGATGALIHVIGGSDMTLDDISKVGELVTESLDDDANVIWGARVAEDMKGKLTVIIVIAGIQTHFGDIHEITKKKYPLVSMEDLGIEFITGIDVQLNSYAEGDIPYIKLKNLNKTGTVEIGSVARINKKNINLKKNKLTKVGDILAARRFVLEYNPVIIKQSEANCLISDDLIVLRVKKDSKILLEHLYSFMKSSDFRLQIHRMQDSVSELISITNLKKIKVPLPSLNEQLLIKTEKDSIEIKNMKLFYQIQDILYEFKSYKTPERIVASKFKLKELFEIYKKLNQKEIPNVFKKIRDIPELLSIALNVKDSMDKDRKFKEVIDPLKKIRNTITHHDTPELRGFNLRVGFEEFLFNWYEVAKSTFEKDSFNYNLKDEREYPDYVENVEEYPNYIKDFVEKKKFIEIKNPYIKGGPLDENSREVFKGRQDVFDFISSNFEKSKRENILLLIGPRRTGKTSTLNLLHLNISNKYVPVFIDLQAGCNEGINTFFESIASNIKEKLESISIDTQIPSSEEFKSRPMFTFKDYLNREIQPKINNKKIILMFDEFEALDVSVKNGKIDKIVFDNLRHLMQHNKILRFIFSGTHRLEDKYLSDYWSFLFQLVDYHTIGYLNKKYTYELIQDPVKEFNMFYEKAALERIYKYSGGHPYVVQFMCWYVVDEIHNKEKKDLITANDVEKITGKIVEGQFALFDYIWSDSSKIVPSSQKIKEKLSNIMLLALSKLLEENKGTSAADIVNHLAEKYDYKVDLKQIQNVLETLKDKYILNKKSDSNNWFFKLDILRLWIKKTKNIEEELEKTIPGETIKGRMSEEKILMNEILQSMMAKGASYKNYEEIRSIIFTPSLVNMDPKDVTNVLKRGDRIKIDVVPTDISKDNMKLEQLQNEVSYLTKYKSHLTKRSIKEIKMELANIQTKITSFNTKNKKSYAKKLDELEEQRIINQKRIYLEEEIDMLQKKIRKETKISDNRLIDKSIEIIGKNKKLKGLILYIETDGSKNLDNINKIIEFISEHIPKNVNLVWGAKINKLIYEKMRIRLFMICKDKS